MLPSLYPLNDAKLHGLCTNIIGSSREPHSRHHVAVSRMTMLPPPKTALRPAAPRGILPVADRPKYQLPMSVNLPFSVNMAALGPTLETLLRNDPK